jgi:hypothetical protein
MAKKQVTVSLRKPPSPETKDAFVRGTTAQEECIEVPAEQLPEDRLAPPVSAVCSRPSPDTLPEMDFFVPELGAMLTAQPAVVFEASMSQDEVVTDISPPNPPVVSHLSTVVTPTGTKLRPVTVYLQEEVAEQLTMYCITNDRDVSNVVGEMLSAQLSPPIEAASDVSADVAPEMPNAEGPAPSAWSRLRNIPQQVRPLERISQWGRSVRGFVQRKASKMN